MKRTFIEILIILGVFAIAWLARGKYSPKIVDNTVTDTVYVDKPYKVTEIKEVEKPVRVVEYKTVRDTVTKVELRRDTVEISTLDNTYTYNTTFLTAYPTTPRLLGARKAGQNLTVSYQRVSGETLSKVWDVGDRGYEIGLSGGDPNIRTFNDDKVSVGAEVEAGMLGSFNYYSPYLELSAEFRILGVDIVGSGNLNTKPFGKLGIKHRF